ncbi:zinc finger protein 565-like, partial [Manduca sexta]|uniref:zinc finger protein 565-like n=1 Tax=Manduca sexta TaxID=7130 RepID=UPI00188DD30E
ERPFACETCGATFSQRSNLHSHRRATHLNEKRHACSLCPKQFKRRRLLDYHVKASHTGERPLKCEVCSSTFVYPEHYKKHIRTHSGERPYVCEICGKTFTTRDNRNTHRFVHSDKKPYEVPCLRRRLHAQAPALRTHEPLLNSNNNKPYEGLACGAGFMRKHLLYEHMNHSPYECLLCLRRRLHAQAPALRTHEPLRELIVITISPTRCLACGAGFMRKHLLYEHMNHSHNKPYECPAAAPASRKHLLYEHMNHPNNNKPYEAQACGAGFMRKHLLYEHMNHSYNNKPYECLACGAGFMRKHLLYEHMNHSLIVITISPTSASPAPGFMRKHLLYEHMNHS